MSASFEIIGFDEVFEMLDEMEITESDKRKALNKAGKIIKNSVEDNLSFRTGKLKKSVKQKIKHTDDGLSVIVHTGKFYDVFEEFGVSFAKHKTGAFENAVTNVEDEVISIVIKELLD